MVSIPRILKSRWWRFPITWWWRSLPLRVVLTVFVASVLVLVLGGFLLMQQATIGVIDGKKETAKSDARQAVNTAQQQLNAATSLVMSTSTTCSSTWPPVSPIGP